MTLNYLTSLLTHKITKIFFWSYIVVFLPVALCSSFFDPAVRSLSDVSRPPLLDLRQSRRVFSPVDQGECNLCFAAAANTAFEYWAGTQLSLQHMLDCSRPAGHSACKSGGDVDRLMRWALNEGVPILTQKAPSVFADGICNTCDACDAHPSDVVFQLEDFGFEAGVSVGRLEELLWKYGPVVTNAVVAIDESVVENDLVCKRIGTRHSVSVVGYTDTHFIVKNSWGTKWANNGYVKIKKEDRTCGIRKKVWYVKYASMRLL